MATRLTGQITAQDTPSIVFTAYEAFWLKIDIAAGTNTIKLQADIGDDSDWQDYTSYTASSVAVIAVPSAMKFRVLATVFDTGPIDWTVRGKLNANDTIGGATPGATLLDETGDGLLEEDGSTPIYEEAA